MAAANRPIADEGDLVDSLLIELDTLANDNRQRMQNGAGDPLSTNKEKRAPSFEPILQRDNSKVTSANKPVKEIITEMERKFDGRVRSLQQALVSYRESLEFTQREVDSLKDENVNLKNKIEDLEMEEKRNEYQVKKVDEKVDKQDTLSRRKNLVIKGIPESSNKKEKENLQPVIYGLMDQMGVRKDITYDTAYRIEPYTGRKPRSILITFIRISDRDEVFSRRFNLNRNPDYSRIWVNEDLGQNPRRAVNLIRTVARHPQLQGIPHRASKFAIQIDQQKFDERNLEELPPHLCLARLKTVQLDDDTIAYQSEHSYLSNLFKITVRVGKHAYQSSEQAYHHIRAVSLKKPLAASRILLARDPYEIMNIGAELTSTKQWEDCEEDIMYGCILRKFEQNPELLKQLIATGHKQLVEATPKTKWGAGATLSSNILKQCTWKGHNKPGQILMTVRDTLRNRAETESRRT